MQRRRGGHRLVGGNPGKEMSKRAVLRWLQLPPVECLCTSTVPSSGCTSLLAQHPVLRLRKLGPREVTPEVT